MQEILSRTSRLSRLDMPGIARVLDVANTGSGGLVVSEWIRGGSLAEVAETSPSPIGGARAIQSLAAAAEAAHRAGVALSIDHPSRVRVSIEGDVALAFPATLPDATPEDDIRGIGAALYALLINRWPLPESGVPSGLAPAELDAAGQPVEPRAVDRDIPFQISAAAAARGAGGRRHPQRPHPAEPAAAGHRDRRPHRAHRAGRRTRSRPAGAVPRRAPADPEAAARRRKGLMIGLRRRRRDRRRRADRAGVGAEPDLRRRRRRARRRPARPQRAAVVAPRRPRGANGTVVKPVRATVFSPEGEADAPDLAGLAIDGNPSTVWPIDTYSDPVPFPNFKNGVGLMLQLPKPTKLGAVTINVDSTGTAVQIRSSPTATPASLDDTTVLTQPTPLKPGPNTIEVDNADADIQRAGVDLDAGHGQRQEPLRHRRDHPQSRLLTAIPSRPGRLPTSIRRKLVSGATLGAV